MTAQEFSDEFDVEYNNIMSDMAPGLDAYEKSKFLTSAQEEIVIKLYSGDVLGAGFEGTELDRRYLANLIRTQVIDTSNPPIIPTTIGKFKNYSLQLSDDILTIISERTRIVDNCYPEGKIVNVVPVTYDELNKVMNNPFRRPNKRKVLRKDTSTNGVDIISSSNILEYTCDYLKKPSPIIVDNINPLKINGKAQAQTSELHESLHRTIIKYAVQLAAASWASNNKS